MRVTSKKKRPPTESCVDVSAASDMSATSDTSLPSVVACSSDTAPVTSSLNSAELGELQELLRQKRCELELQEDTASLVDATVHGNVWLSVVKLLYNI